jgi:hypothetical protein
MSIVQIPGRETVWKRELSNRDQSDHFVYIIGQLSSAYEVIGPVKVGISSNPLSRMQSVQTGSPSRLVMVSRYCFWKRTHAHRVEQCFHRTCANYRLEGEWFDIVPDAAVALMAANVTAFVQQVLQPEETGDLFFALDHIGLPGFAYDLDGLEFDYGT